jgi:hypothetical protein
MWIVIWLPSALAYSLTWRRPSTVIVRTVPGAGRTLDTGNPLGNSRAN